MTQLTIPAGVSFGEIVDGVRELRAYDVANDQLVIRFDKIIDGAQITVTYRHENDAGEALLPTYKAKALSVFASIDGGAS